jgi:AcrR family transcriptional regulator
MPERSRPSTVGNITFFHFTKICSVCNNYRMGTPGEEPGGLRERKKRATRLALSEAALRLALDRGLEQLTVEEISEAAGVSARTFFNYFTSKEHALLGDGPAPPPQDRVTELVGTARTVLDGLCLAVQASVAASAGSREQFRMRWELMEQHPALLPRLFARMEDFRATLATAVAAAAGGAATDAYPQLMASVALATMRVAVDRWLAAGGDQSLEDHVGELFGLLTAELGEPAKRGMRA